MFLFVLGLAAIGLLLFGLVEVWHGRWRVMWAGVGAAAAYIAICATADIWFSWFGLNRGDGFVLIGLAMFAAIGLVVTAGALVLAAAIHLLRKPALRRKLSTKDA